MKTNVQKVLATIVLSVGILAGGAAVNQVNAYYADSTSAVYQGMDSSGRYLVAINVVDDDGTVYTFHYKTRPRSGDNSYRVEGDSTWYGMEPKGKNIEPSHLDMLAWAGLKMIYQTL